MSVETLVKKSIGLGASVDELLFGCALQKSDETVRLKEELMKSNFKSI